MNGTHRVVAAVMALWIAPFLLAQTTDDAILAGIKGLRSLSAEQRPVETVNLAHEVDALPAGEKKLELADYLCQLVTEGDQGKATIETVADTLAKALSETPLAAKEGEPE